MAFMTCWMYIFLKNEFWKNSVEEEANLKTRELLSPQSL